MSDSHFIDTLVYNQTIPVYRGDWGIQYERDSHTWDYVPVSFFVASCGHYAEIYNKSVKIICSESMELHTDKEQLCLADMYPVIRGAGTSEVLTYVLKRAKSSKVYPVYYPRGTILWYTDHFIVTTSVCDVRSPSGKSYSKLYPWCPTTLYATGDYVVWDGAIYQALSDVSSTTESPSADNLNWKLVQYAPLCRIGAVLPPFLADYRFECCCSANTLFSVGDGGLRNSASQRVMYYANILEEFEMILATRAHSTSDYFKNLSLSFPTGVKASTAKVISPNSYSGVWCSIGDVVSYKGNSGYKFYWYHNSSVPLSVCPETMLGSISDYGVNIGTTAMPFSDGNTLTIPVSASSYKNSTDSLTYDTTITHNRGRVPILIPNLIDRPVTDPSQPASTNGAMSDATHSTISYLFFYDPYSDCIRYCHQRVATFRYFPTYTELFTKTGLFFMYNEFPFQRSELYSSCVGQIIQALGNLIAFNCDTLKDGLGKSLLYDLFLYKAISSCDIKLYYVKKDNGLSQINIDGFLDNKSYCTYVGMVDLCNDNIYSISNLPGVVFPVASETVVFDSTNDKVYISKKYIGKFNGDYKSHVAKGDIEELPKTKHNEIVAPSKDVAKKVFKGLDVPSSTVIYKDEKTGETKDAGDSVVSKSDNDTEVIVKPYPDVEKEETVVLPSLDDCVVDNSANGIYTAKASLKRTELTADNTVKKGIAYGSLFLWDLSAVKSVKKGCYFYSGELIYRATADLTSVTSSNCVEVGRILYGTIYALYSDYATNVKWLKGQYLIYRGHTSYQGYTSYVILQAQDKLSFNSNDETEYLDTKKFKKVGVFYYTWEDCTHKKLNYALEYDTFPSWFELPASSNVVRDNKVINIVKPVNGGLDLTGQVLAGYIVNKAPV